MNVIIHSRMQIFKFFELEHTTMLLDHACIGQLIYTSLFGMAAMPFLCRGVI